MRLLPVVVQSLLLIELSLFQVVFEGDSLRVIQAINNQGENFTLFGHLIDYAPLYIALVFSM